MTGPRIYPKGVPLQELFMRQNETTRLTPQQEAAFQQWLKTTGITDADDPRSAYDYRGAYLANQKSATNSTDNAPHWPDTYKQHGHPTFSIESKYSKGPNDGGKWGGMMGEQYAPPTDLLSRIALLLRDKP